MARRKRLSCLLLAVSLFCLATTTASALGWLIEEERHVEAGPFRGFQIGSSKQASAEQIKKLNGEGIGSIPPLFPTEISRSNITEFTKLADKNALRLTDRMGTTIDLFLEGLVLQVVQKSQPAEQLAWFTQGQSRAEVLDTLRTILLQNPAMMVLTISRNDVKYWTSLNRFPQKALQIVQGYDGWLFEVSSEKPAGATYRLFFKDDRLARIEYVRPRFSI